MKAEKIIITKEQINIDIKDIALLSIEEYEKCKDIIPKIKEYWWLRTPSYNSTGHVGYIDPNGNMNYKGGFSVFDQIGVRPILITNKNFSKNNLGNKIYFINYKWTIINSNILLWDDIIAQTYFHSDWLANDANDYETSDIKKWLENWLKYCIMYNDLIKG